MLTLECFLNAVLGVDCCWTVDSGPGLVDLSQRTVDSQPGLVELSPRMGDSKR
ncbi:hypothetical protein ACFSUM_15290 [Virgibacillus siamensis]|uniref:hypothetical protein n=1 Tax=Virgibacillus siamensis TaxID=480071 RepID=UPI0031DC74EC